MAFLSRVCASEEVAGCCLWTDVVATSARISGLQRLWRGLLSVFLLGDYQRSTRLCTRREKKKGSTGTSIAWTAAGWLRLGMLHGVSVSTDKKNPTVCSAMEHLVLAHQSLPKIGGFLEEHR